MKIGLDLDHTVYGYPYFFKEMVRLMSENGHEFFCTSGHAREYWDLADIDNLKSLGIDPDKISPELLFKFEDCLKIGGKLRKAAMSKQVDIIFDNEVNLRDHCHCPVFVADEAKCEQDEVVHKLYKPVKKWVRVPGKTPKHYENPRPLNIGIGIDAACKQPHFFKLLSDAMRKHHYFNWVGEFGYWKEDIGGIQIDLFDIWQGLTPLGLSQSGEMMDYVFLDSQSYEGKSINTPVFCVPAKAR